VKPSAFDYVRADTLAEALSVLADVELDARVLAGGQSLVPLLNMRLARPKTLLDVNGVPGLDALEMRNDAEGTWLEVGALVRQRALERYAGKTLRARLLHAALTHIGHPQTRNQGTVGGSLAHADPSAELPLVLTTLGGRVFLRSTRGERQVPAEEFFQSFFTTALQPDELLLKSAWQLPAPRAGVAFREFRRRHGDFALVATACLLEIDSERRVQKIRLGISGVADKPLLVPEAAGLVGEQWEQARVRALSEVVAARLDLEDDIQASAAYRRQLATVALRQSLEAAYADALAKGEDAHATH
jgi:CO/xanthine dehydrogenase FAD-binding subunit